MRISSLMTKPPAAGKVLALSVFCLLLCGGCGKGTIVLPGDDSVVYAITCDNSLDDCHVGAQTLCNGPYEVITGSSPDNKAPGSFGWVDTAGGQQDSGGGGGKYSLRIRCK